MRGEGSALAALIADANRLAVARFASVLVARFAERDARIRAFEAAGFAVDETALPGYVTLVRDVV